MKRHLPALLILAGFAISIRAAAQERVLTPDAEEGFKRLITLTETGHAGPGITNANVGMQRTTARIELVLTGGAHESFVVRPLESGGATVSRYFGITPEAGASPADLEIVRGLLDQSFASDPYLLPPQAGELDFAVRDAPSITEAWKNGGLRSVSFAVLRATLRPAPRGYAYPVIALHLLWLLACLGLLWTSRPSRS